jgi:hypothetical protein
LVRPITIPSIHNLSLMWSAGGSFVDISRSNWSGFMQSVCNCTHPRSASMSFLPIVNLQPTDVNCIYSTLIFISKQATSLNILTPCVTFDQPLFIKALDIVVAEKMDMVVRLGGFHVLLSFPGSVGFVKRWSGLEDLLGVLYGKNVVESILQGKDYERSIRGHFLVSWALETLLFNVILHEQSEDAQSAVNFREPDCSANYHIDTNDIGILENILTFVSNSQIRFEPCSDNDNNVLAQDCLQHASIDKLYSIYNSLRTNLYSITNVAPVDSVHTVY